MDSQLQNDDCGFPNEIFALVIGNLANDLPSLQNLALVCKDFAALAQVHIFREIDLSAERTWAHVEGEPGPKFSYPLIHRLALLLPNQRLARLVQQLSFFSPSIMMADEVETIAHILENLPSLTRIEMICPRLRHFQAIQGSSISQNLKVLHLRAASKHIHVDVFLSLQELLPSLAVLEVLSISGEIGYSTSGILLLPQSLKILSIVTPNKALIRGIGLGLKSLHPLSLQTLLLEYDSDEEACDSLWTGLESDSGMQVVLEMGYYSYRSDGGLSALISATKGIRVSKVLFVCVPSALFPSSFAHVILNISGSVREFCIDISAHIHKELALGPRQNLKLRMQDWADLDSALVDRRNLGLLKRVCFRCTKRTNSHLLLNYRYSCFSLQPRSEHLYAENRTILDDLGGLLPRSMSMGFLEIDYDSLIFQPSM
ncbi:hypothetical protein GYMLUDRAFT_48163 [Collybiopsis luxurians FD-317 M1]|uniref:F-box domain-containing protein n=1 Tax=Collybiopsis luxurians FD-317 M1 TaxID=944289 RepID=A0A0D0BZ54_9AGAR|nr:hypothetical protein GYMLUDRAFT_48163 [Collybiopsis luxurians FD-317 M1]